MHCLVKYLLYFVTVDMVITQDVQYDHPMRTSSCPPEKANCVVVTVCKTAKADIKKRRNPQVCGWDSGIPLVCCQVPEITPKYESKTSKLSPENCGKRKESNGDDDDYTFLVGGQKATVNWPWMVAIFTNGIQRQLCGGTLIDERHVITAAHCFDGRRLEPGLYKVQIGEDLLDDNSRKYAVMDIKLHEGYRRNYYYDDIAIMRLTHPLFFFTAACLPAEDDVHHGDNVTVLGWGDMSYGDPSTPILQELSNILVVGNEICDSKFSTFSRDQFPSGITDTFLCAGLEEGGKDACQGNSGGPLLKEHSKERWTLVGVASLGYMCGELGKPGLYTRVSYFLPWIEDYIGGQNDFPS